MDKYGKYSRVVPAMSQPPIPSPDPYAAVSDFNEVTRRYTCRECGRNHASVDHAMIAKYYPQHAIPLPKYPDARPQNQEEFADRWERLHTNCPTCRCRP